MWGLVAAALLAASFSSSSERTPENASAYTAELGGAKLSPEQTEVVVTWLASHRSGWGPLLATPPVGRAIVLENPADQTTTVITYFPEKDYPGWRKAIVLRKWRAHKFKSGAVASFSEVDLKPLLALARP